MLLRSLILCVLIVLSFACTAQALNTQYAFRISFTDKKGTADISIPLGFLSQRAIDRRSTQNIAIDTIDLPVSPDYIDSVLDITGGVLHVTSKWLNTCVILLEDSSAILPLQGKSYITDIEYIGYYQTGLHNKTASVKFSEETLSDGNKTTGTQSYYNATWTQTHLVNGDCLHDNDWKGQGKLIAVLDDGFNFVDTNPAFDSLYQSGRVLDKYNFVRDTDFVYGYNAHGTEVLSTMAVYMPDSFVGAAPLAYYALYITEDQGSEQPIEMDNMVAAFERADSMGADVVTSSLGYNVFFGPVPYTIPAAQLDGKTTVAAKAVNIATMKGMVMVMTAGNEGSGGLLTPGDADSALTVGNVDANKLPAGSSGTGPNAAGHIKPDVCGLGNPAAVMRNSAAVLYVSGTSLSTPQIAGYTACMMQGGVTGKLPAAIKDAIRRTGHVYNNPTNQLGYGVPDFCSAWHLLGVSGPPVPPLLTVVPNPFTNELEIRLPGNHLGPVDVSLFDMEGRVVYHSIHAHTDNGTLRVVPSASLAPGVYSCRLMTGSKSMFVKLVKR